MIENEIKARSIIVPSKLPGADFVVNPYTGCQHGCIYCYADFMKRYTSHTEEWGEFVDIKSNSPSLVKYSERYRGKRILIGSVTDAYMPIEKKYKITRRILENLLNFNSSIEILTKSKLVLRDVDLLNKFDDITVGMSISVLNDNKCNLLEPKATLGKYRIKTLEALKKEGIKTYLFISPIFPEITEIDRIIDESAPYVDYMMFENLNVRKNNRENVFDFLKNSCPELEGFYKDIYSSRSRTKEYWVSIKEGIEEKCARKGLEYKIYFQHIGID